MSVYNNNGTTDLIPRTRLGGIFSAKSPKNPREYTKYSPRLLDDLTKNLLAEPRTLD